MRFVGEPVAAVVAATEAEAEDIADEVAVDDRAKRQPVIDATRGARRRRAAACMRRRAGNVIVEGRIETPGFRRCAELARTA